MNCLNRLTDIQLILLASAAARNNGSLLPPPETFGEGSARIRKVVLQLIRRGLAAEAELPDGADVWRMEGKRPIGVVITAKGHAALAIDPKDDRESVETHLSAALTAVSPSADTAVLCPPVEAIIAPSGTKSAQIITLLGRREGATLDELIAATGWLPHTTRAALTGLRKKGHVIERTKRGDISCYILNAKAAA